MIYDLIIIGGGPAGLYAAYLAGSKDLNACLIESADKLGGQLELIYPHKFIYDLPSIKEISAKTFSDNLYLQLATYKDKVNIFLDQKAIFINELDAYVEVKTNHQVFLTKKVLVTNGGGTFEPRKLEYNNDNIFYFMHDVSEVLNQDIVILGGGDSAIDYAIMIQDYVKSLTIIHRRNDFRASPGSLDKIAAHVNILKPYNIVDINSDNQIIFEKGEENNTLNFDKLYCFYGSIKGKSKLTINGGIINSTLDVLPNMKTNYLNIYAAGNACSYLGKVDLIVTALAESATAITNIADEIYPNRNNRQFSTSKMR